MGFCYVVGFGRLYIKNTKYVIADDARTQQKIWSVSLLHFFLTTRKPTISTTQRQVDVAEAWVQVSAGTCLYHMASTDILGYCVFDQVIDLADEAATAAIEAEMGSYLNGTGANYTVVSSETASSSWFEGDAYVCVLLWKESIFSIYVINSCFYV